MKFTRLLGEYDAETQAFSAFAGPSGASPYQPDFDGTMTGVRIVISRTAATSLTNGVIFRLTCTNWAKSNTVEFAVCGSGLQTAPAFQAPTFDYSVNLPIKAGVPIKLEGKCVDASQLTNTILMIGVFEG